MFKSQSKVYTLMPVDINEINRYGMTRLIDAIRENDLPKVKELLSLGASHDVASLNEHLLPLHWAVKSKEPAIVEELLGAGADVDASDPNGNTALHLAVDRMDLNLAKLLIERGADVHAENSNRWNVINFALKNNDGDAINFFTNAGVRFNNAAHNFIQERNIKPELSLQGHPFANDYPIVRTMWNVFGGNSVARTALLNKNPLQRDRGEPSEILSFLKGQLSLFATTNMEHSVLLQNISGLFSPGATESGHLKIPNHNRTLPGFAKIVPVRQNQQKAALLIKTYDHEYMLIISERGGYRLPLTSINIPAEKLSQVLSNLRTFGRNPEFTRNHNEIISDINMRNYNYQRGYIENYYPLILFLMQLSLGIDKGKILFKQFLLSMRQNVLNVYKEYFDGKLDEKDNELIGICERIIVDKIESLQSWQNIRTPKAKFGSHVLNILKKAYQKTFYNPEDSAESRLFSFLELPHVARRYNVLAKRVEDKSADSQFIDWIAYIGTGFIVLPIKNMIKLFVEFLPSTIEEIANRGIKKLYKNYNHTKNLPLLLLSGAGIPFLKAIYYLAKAVKVVARVAMSPSISAQYGWNIHPALGVLSTIFSIAAIGFLTFLATPIFAYAISLAALSLGLTKLAAAALAYAYFLFDSTIGRVIAGFGTAITLISPVIILIKSVFNSFTGFVKLSVVKFKELSELADDLQSLRSTLETAPKSSLNQSTTVVMQALDVSAITLGSNKRTNHSQGQSYVTLFNCETGNNVANTEQVQLAIH